MQVLDGAKLDVEQVSDLAVTVGIVADPVKLEVGQAQARLIGLFAKLLAPGKLDAVGRRLNADVAQLSRVAGSVEKIGRQGGLAARKLHGHLPLGLDFDGVIQDLLDLVPGQFVHIAHLVGVHEARITHHVAAVGKVHGEDRPTPVTDRAGAVVVEVLVVVGGNIPSREVLFDP